MSKVLVRTVLFTVIGLIWLAINLIVMIPATYKYEREISSNWELADKASTIAQKSEYIDRFVTALEAQGLGGKYNALIYPTPNNSFDRNLEALKSLQLRLREIQTMKPDSFEYQTAMQQITGQEQGEAKAMLDVFEGTWWLQHHPLLWDWIGTVNWAIVIGLLGTGGIMFLYWALERV